MRVSSALRFRWAIHLSAGTRIVLDHVRRVDVAPTVVAEINGVAEATEEVIQAPACPAQPPILLYIGDTCEALGSGAGCLGNKKNLRRQCPLDNPLGHRLWIEALCVGMDRVIQPLDFDSHVASCHVASTPYVRGNEGGSSGYPCPNRPDHPSAFNSTSCTHALRVGKGRARWPEQAGARVVRRYLPPSSKGRAQACPSPPTATPAGHPSPTPDKSR